MKIGFKINCSGRLRESPTENWDHLTDDEIEDCLLDLVWLEVSNSDIELDKQDLADFIKAVRELENKG